MTRAGTLFTSGLILLRFSLHISESAFYVFPNIEVFGICSEKFSEFVREDAHFITVSGSAFDCRGEGYIRVSYAAAFGHYEKALDRIEAAVKSFR